MHAFLLSAIFIQSLLFKKNYFRNTIRVSNSLDPDQDRPTVGPDLGPNCLQRLSVNLKSPLARKELYNHNNSGMLDDKKYQGA